MRAYVHIQSVADVHGIDEVFEDTHVRRRPSRRIQDSVLLESIGHRDSLSCKDCIMTNVYFPVLDLTVSELERRFSTAIST